jgi:Ca2+:H+ antiporter
MIRRLLDLPGWSVVVPVAACLMLLVPTGGLPTSLGLAIVIVTLVVSVLVAVYHAEVVAHAVGEPFGTLTLALAVTVIETSLIVSMMLSGGEPTRALARDTVYAAVMIVCNGVVGLCLTVGALRHRVTSFRIDATSPTLSVLVALSALVLVLPAFTRTTAGPTYSTAQLIFVGVVSLVLYALFVFVQTVRHRDYFLPVGVDDEQHHAAPPAPRTAFVSLVLLFVSLVAVVGLAKKLAPSIESGVEAASAPPAVVGIAIALLVLLPETVAAVRAARRDRMQTSLNLALGSGLATIGLTIPTVVVISLLLGISLELGVPPVEMVLLALTLLVSTVTLATGRSTVLQGAVHLVLFAVFLFLAVLP